MNTITLNPPSNELVLVAPASEAAAIVAPKEDAVVSQVAQTTIDTANAPVATVVEEKKAEAPLAEKVTHVCHGHEKFVAHYSSKKRANRHAEKEVKNLLKDATVANASAELIEKNSGKGKESGYFRMLNKVYNYALLVNYKHNEGATNCYYHPAYKA